MGMWGGVVGGAVEGGSTASNWLGQKKRGKPPSIGDFDWYGSGKLKKGIADQATNKMENPTQYQDNPSFNLDQPAVESETEKAILGGLRNLPQKREDIQGIYGKYAEAEKASARAQQEIEQRKLGDRYNRLGLVSSTPGLQASTDLGRQQGIDLNLIDSRVNKDAVQAEMDSTRLAEDIANQYMTQGQNLGNKQRGYQQWGKEMSAADIERQSAEQEAWAQIANQYLSQGASSPEQQYGSRLFQWQQPNTWDWLAAGARNTWGGVQSGATMSGGR